MSANEREALQGESITAEGLRELDDILVEEIRKQRASDESK